MGQHNRTVTCTRCPSTALLKVAVATWRGSSTCNSTKWVCPDCAAAAKRPAVTATRSIQLPPRQVSTDRAPLRELPTMSVVSRQGELPPARQAPLDRHRSIPRALPRLSALASGLLFLNLGAFHDDSEEDREVLDMRERLDELGASYTLMMSRTQLERFEASTRYHLALRRLRVEATADPEHQDNSATVVAVQVRSA